MATTVQDFKAYIKNNAKTLDKNKLSGMTKEQNKALYNEWKSTGSIPKSYFASTTTATPASVANVKSQPTTSTSFGQVSTTNTQADKLENTAQTFSDTTSKAAQDAADAQIKWGQSQADIIKQTNEAAKERSAEQQAELDKNKQRAEQADADRRAQSANIVRRQEEIASRQANIAAAQAGASGLQMSDAAISDAKNDIIAKYGENVANAEQFALQTNMTLDQALTNLDANIFKDKQTIDNFLNSLDEKERAPILAAIAESTKGNVQAVNDVKDFYNAITQEKAKEETGRTLELERIEDQQRNWNNLNSTQRWALLSNKLNENKWAMDAYWANPTKYNNMSYEEAISTLSKVVQNVTSLNNQWLMQYLVNKTNAEVAGKPFTEIPAFETMLKESYTSVDQTNRTAEEKTSQRPETAKASTNLTLSANTKSQLDTALSKVGKAALVSNLDKLLKNGKVTASQFQNLINYVNSK